MKIKGRIKDDGRPTFGDGFRSEAVYEKLKKYKGQIFTLEVSPYESKSERKFFEGAIVPYFCSLIEPYEPRNGEDRGKVREMLKQEFGGEVVPSLSGGVTKVCVTSKGQIKKILEGVTNYLETHGNPIPDPKLYIRWRDELLAPMGDYWLWLEANGLNVDGTKKDL